MTLVEDALAAVEQEERRKALEQERRLPMRRARFCDVLWDALAIKLDSKQLEPGEPSYTIDGLTFVLMGNDAQLAQAQLGLQTQCSQCEVSMRFSISSVLGLGLLISAPPPLCSVCTAQREAELHPLVYSATVEAQTPEQKLVQSLRDFILHLER